MQNGNMQVKDLFNGDRIFNIPKYQRTYSWEKENLEDFLEDLKNQRDLDTKYFLGTFLFHKKDDKSSYEYLDVVDGQQRLTTIIIFLKIILTLLKEKESEFFNERIYRKYIYDGECYKIELENDDNSFLQKFILNDSKCQSHETNSQKKLYSSKEYFKKKLSIFSIEELEKMYTVLTEAKVIVYVVNEVSDATQIFELLNDRGKRLTSLEGIKSFLMYRIGCLKLNNKDHHIDIIQSDFSSIYRIIEEGSVNEDEVLRAHTIAFEECKSEDYNSPEKFIKNKINMMFNLKENDLKIKDEIISYVNRLHNSYILYKKIKTNSIKSKSLDKLFMIGRVNPFIPLIMNIYDKESEERIERFIESICRFTFRASLIGLRNDNEAFYGYIRKKEYFLDIFKKIVDENWWNINARVDQFIRYQNYYEWINKNIIKYILFSYENDLRIKKGYPLLTIEDYFSEDSRLKFSIEHITAQKSEKFKNENIKNEKFKEEYLHYIGNLVIDTVASNSRKGNKNVDEKEKEFFEAPLMSQNEINTFDVNWNNLKNVQEFIHIRGEKIIEFIEEKLL